MANHISGSKIAILNVLFHTQYSSEESFFENVPTATLLDFIQRRHWHSHPKLVEFKNYLVTHLTLKENESSLAERVNQLRSTLSSPENTPAGISPDLIQNDSWQQNQLLSSSNNNNNNNHAISAQAESHYQEALQLEQQNRWEEAKIKYSQASLLQHPEAAYKLGIIHKNVHPLAAAGFFYKAAERGKGEAWIELASMYAGWGLHSEAVNYYNQAPQHLQTNHNFAIVNLQAGVGTQGHVENADMQIEETNDDHDHESSDLEYNHNNNNVEPLSDHESANEADLEQVMDEMSDDMESSPEPIPSSESED
ncbi:MAG: sel1 repeat family protein [Parachlamydiaceae bacterium]|nr:MAG: sel1 repeat family protein [Parachlamydiaceae bacterium]